ncbi:MAG: hypothetical protein K6F37_00200 [Lachnospiraceae bacterium]|nr:hypothetical protein [Lachnospiraceae bacterium]
MGAEFEYETLQKEYGNFVGPRANAVINGTSIRDSKLFLGNVVIENTCNYEASIATFMVFETYDAENHKFKTDEFSKIIQLGATVEISVGYEAKETMVFVGYIAKVAFHVDTESPACVEVTALDIKAMMMAGKRSMQLEDEYYSDAVKTLLGDSRYSGLLSEYAPDLENTIEDSPDKKQGAAGAAAAAVEAAQQAAIQQAGAALSDKVTDSIIGGLGEALDTAASEAAEKAKYAAKTAAGTAAGVAVASVPGAAGIMEAAQTAMNTIDRVTDTVTTVMDTIKQAKETEAQIKETIKQAMEAKKAAEEAAEAALALTAPPGKPTPKPGVIKPAREKTIEMVDESDYEFVIKVAKRYDYEFFVVAGKPYFRKAKSIKPLLITLNSDNGIKALDIEYDLTTQVGKVEVRATNPTKGALISSSQKIGTKLSMGSKTKQIVSNAKYVYVDSTLFSKEDAEDRAKAIADEISYRFGTLEMEMVGLPEMMPGRFICVTSFGEGVSNNFYVTSVRHIYDTENGYITRITAKAPAVEFDANAVL